MKLSMRIISVRSRMLFLVTTLSGLAVAYNLSPRTGANLMTMQTSDAQTISNHATTPNPLLPKWEGEYGGVPPFDRVQVNQFKPALEAGMAENLAEIEKIAKDPAAPTFENTIDALERSGATLDRAVLIAHCRKHMAAQKTPVQWFEVAAWPLTGSGKIQKFVLRDQVISGALVAS